MNAEKFCKKSDPFSSRNHNFLGATQNSLYIKKIKKKTLSNYSVTKIKNCRRSLVVYQLLQALCSNQFLVSPGWLTSGKNGGTNFFSLTSVQLVIEINHLCLFTSSVPMFILLLLKLKPDSPNKLSLLFVLELELLAVDSAASMSEAGLPSAEMLLCTSLLITTGTGLVLLFSWWLISGSRLGALSDSCSWCSLVWAKRGRRAAERLLFARVLVDHGNGLTRRRHPAQSQIWKIYSLLSRLRIVAR
ncbi:hypothetical protein BpHYR1_012046 [Brachionus plicatilis]|uniref:Uncharacterized protein n=1 Tax=Brachionus plicatilis TaxID=10195 RepID=A0A3M7SVS9_BRAPC|nr:hypothetical protein BpHYR1_012046 [Brachionus plicatilis]